MKRARVDSGTLLVDLEAREADDEDDEDDEDDMDQRASPQVGLVSYCAFLQPNFRGFY